MPMNKKILLLTTTICMLPLILGAALYNYLPAEIPIHWDASGSTDRYCNKLLAIIGQPLFFALINIIVHYRVSFSADGTGSKIINIITLWICPVLSVIVLTIVFLTAANF
jgi:uncharacterized membrane protein